MRINIIYTFLTLGGETSTLTSLFSLSAGTLMISSFVRIEIFRNFIDQYLRRENLHFVKTPFVISHSIFGFKKFAAKAGSEVLKVLFSSLISFKHNTTMTGLSFPTEETTMSSSLLFTEKIFELIGLLAKSILIFSTSFFPSQLHA